MIEEVGHMRCTVKLSCLIGSLVLMPTVSSLANDVPIVSGQKSPPIRNVGSKSLVPPVIVGASPTVSSRPESKGPAGVIQLIQRPGTQPSQYIEQPPLTDVQPLKYDEGLQIPVPKVEMRASKSPGQSKPIKAIQTPLVVRRTPELKVQIEAEKTAKLKHRVVVKVNNESGHAAGRTTLAVTVPEELQVSQLKPEPMLKERQGEVTLLLYSLEGLAASEENEIGFSISGSEDCRGLVCAVVNTEAESSQLINMKEQEEASSTDIELTSKIEDDKVAQPAFVAEPDVADNATELKADPTAASEAVEAVAEETVAEEAEVQSEPKKREAGPIRSLGVDLPLLVAGPTRAKKGSTLLYSVSLENLSEYDLGDIEIRAIVPNGVFLEGRPELELTDRLPSGQQRSMDIAIRTQRSGEFQLQFEAWHEGTRLAKKTHDVSVVASDLRVGMGGPQSWSLNREATFEIDLACDGDEPIKDIVVTLQLPENVRVTTVEHQAGIDEERRLMAWKVVELKPGSSVKLRYKAVGSDVGQAVQTIHVKTPDLNSALNTSLTSEVKRTVGLRLNTDFLYR